MISCLARFTTGDGVAIGDPICITASIDEKYWQWWLGDSHLFYCEQCGTVIGRVDVTPGEGCNQPKTHWQAHAIRCKEHQPKYRFPLEVHQWRQLPNHLTFYPLPILEEIFLSELAALELEKW